MSSGQIRVIFKPTVQNDIIVVRVFVTDKERFQDFVVLIGTNVH